VPGIERFPARILAVDERKWCAHATLEDASGTDEGWVIHEVVRWPEAPAEAPAPEKSAPQGSAAGKLLYGLLFVAVLPALLASWARATESVVPAPAWHDPALGRGLVATGAVLVLAGWAALWRFGGGLPMNAFPPPRYVTRGVYAIVAHPIYVGFGAICFGASIATGSASGLWLVSPTVVLGMIALVLGYEKQDLDARFGEGRARPWLSVPRPGDAAPTFAQRLSAVVLAVAPWLGVHAASTLHGAGSIDARTAALCLLGLSAPFAVASRTDLRALVVRSLLAMPLVFPLHTLLPFVTPSLLAVVALLAADAWTSRARWTRWIVRTLALVLAAGALTPAPGVLFGLAASGAAYAAAANAKGLWEGVRAVSEHVANSWHATQVGPMRVISHGKWAGLAAFGGILIIGSGLGPGPGHFATLVVGAAGGLLGAGLWAQGIEGSAALSRPFGFYGGLLGICIGALAAPLFGTPIWLLLGSVSLAAPFIQGVGRMRCLVQGCCHGSETNETLGIRVHHPVSRVCRLAHLDGVPIHPTPTYSILVNVVTFIVIAHLFRVHAPLHLIGGVYFILNGTGRFVEEAYRGEPQTPVYARLRLYQWAALLQVVTGAVITAVASSAAAPTPRLNAAALAAAALFGPIYWFALGVDFPKSNRRFSRLA
jgi:protein-S-isoprenylcysteine O-methyltransferase Ste14